MVPSLKLFTIFIDSFWCLFASRNSRYLLWLIDVDCTNHAEMPVERHQNPIRPRSLVSHKGKYIGDVS
jgi:hypothetical protein